MEENVSIMLIDDIKKYPEQAGVLIKQLQKRIDKLEKQEKDYDEIYREKCKESKRLKDGLDTLINKHLHSGNSFRRWFVKDLQALKGGE